jgi:hypothetical protein
MRIRFGFLSTKSPLAFCNIVEGSETKLGSAIVASCPFNGKHGLNSGTRGHDRMVGPAVGPFTAPCSTHKEPVYEQRVAGWCNIYVDAVHLRTARPIALAPGRCMLESSVSDLHWNWIRRQQPIRTRRRGPRSSNTGAGGGDRTMSGAGK